jgi:hypothetical protein
VSVRSEVARERRQKIELDRRKLLKPEWGQLGVRFAFGAGIAVAAGLVGLRWGPRAGGAFLAFPAILPAALTLLERASGTAKTDVDAVGACLGAVAILLFAIAVALLGGRLGVLVVAVAAVIWIAAALALFAAGRPWLTRLTEKAPRAP